jgi:hypothetical protein
LSTISPTARRLTRRRITLNFFVLPFIMSPFEEENEDVRLLDSFSRQGPWVCRKKRIFTSVNCPFDRLRTTAAFSMVSY